MTTPVSDPPPAAEQGPSASAVQAHLRRVALQASAPWLHTEVARRMVDRLQWIKLRPDAAIDWWSVQGGSLALLQSHYPKARIHAVEPTAALAARASAERRGPWWSRWQREAPSIWREDAAPSDGAAQLVWSNMMLHWSRDPKALFARWRAALAVDGFVMFSCFGPDTLRQLRSLYRRCAWGGASHTFIDMHDLGDALVGAGFADPVMDMETLKLTWADAANLLGELRLLGGNASSHRHAGLRTPRWRTKLLHELEASLAGPDGRLALDFEIVYGHAFAPPQRLPVARETRVSADQLQAMARKGRPRTPDA